MSPALASPGLDRRNQPCRDSGPVATLVASIAIAWPVAAVPRLSQSGAAPAAEAADEAPAAGEEGSGAAAATVADPVRPQASSARPVSAPTSAFLSRLAT
jgi:hypothetical protein